MQRGVLQLTEDLRLFALAPLAPLHPGYLETRGEHTCFYHVANHLVTAGAARQPRTITLPIHPWCTRKPCGKLFSNYLALRRQPARDSKCKFQALHAMQCPNRRFCSHVNIRASLIRDGSRRQRTSHCCMERFMPLISRIYASSGTPILVFAHTLCQKTQPFATLE